jgi:hypothetical protein
MGQVHVSIPLPKNPIRRKCITLSSLLFSIEMDIEKWLDWSLHLDFGCIVSWQAFILSVGYKAGIYKLTIPQSPPPICGITADARICLEMTMHVLFHALSKITSWYMKNSHKSGSFEPTTFWLILLLIESSSLHLEIFEYFESDQLSTNDENDSHFFLRKSETPSRQNKKFTNDVRPTK